MLKIICSKIDYMHFLFLKNLPKLTESYFSVIYGPQHFPPCFIVFCLIFLHVSFSYYLEKNGKLIFSRTIFWFWSKVQCPALDMIEVKSGCVLWHQITPDGYLWLVDMFIFLKVYNRKCWFLNNMNRFLWGT